MTTVPDRLLLRCGIFLDGTGTPAKEDVALSVESGRIVAVDPWRDWVSSHGESEKHLDLRHHTIVPGLIDAHAHLCLGAPSNPDWASAITDSIGIVAWGMASGVAALRTGVTTIVDAGSQAGLALRLATLVDTGLAVGPRILAAGPAITTTAGHGEAFGTTADNTEELIRAVRSVVAAGAAIIKIMVTGGATDPSSNRRRAQYSQEELEAAISDAHRLGKSVIGHANATEGITRAVRAGIDIVAHCNWLGSAPGTIYVDTDTVEAMVRQKVWIDLNIEGALRDLQSTDGLLPTPSTMHNPQPIDRWELLQPLRKQGVGLYLTSDGFGPAVGAFTKFLCDGRAKWNLSAEEIISLVSSKPALALGIDDFLGTLVPGKLADFVVLTGDLRSENDALLRPRSVYRNGIKVVANGMLRPTLASLASDSEASAQQNLLDSVFRKLG